MEFSSRTLCDIYLGRIENSLFVYGNNGISQPAKMRLNTCNELVLRVVDDYLVIGSDFERLEQIKERLKSRVDLNETKTLTRKWQVSATTTSNIEQQQQQEHAAVEVDDKNGFYFVRITSAVCACFF